MICLLKTTYASRMLGDQSDQAASDLPDLPVQVSWTFPCPHNGRVQRLSHRLVHQQCARQARQVRHSARACYSLSDTIVQRHGQQQLGISGTQGCCGSLPPIRSFPAGKSALALSAESGLCATVSDLAAKLLHLDLQ